MNTHQPPPVRPDRLTAVAVMTLVSGVLNFFWSVVLFVTLSAFGILTFPFGCICFPLGFYPLVLGIFEILYAAKLLRHPAAPAAKPAYHIAVMEVIDTLFGNVAALIVGVTALIFYNDRSVRHFFGDA